MRQVYGQAERDPKLWLISEALIRWREGVSTLDGGRPLLDRTAVTTHLQARPPSLLLTISLAHPATISHALHLFTTAPSRAAKHWILFKMCKIFDHHLFKLYK